MPTNPEHSATMAQLAEARTIVCNPQSRPQQLLIAWAALKTAQGKPLGQIRAARIMDAGKRQQFYVLQPHQRIGGAA